ncbi:hypothetical protein [Pseudomonas sp. LAM2023]|uniref:hypothetical protein n=1 Tax=Pseudomonas sp. LAM2023 TaxID=2800477 RepID=UPI00190B8FB4|nr:hypothetical protein [Pseudomonas sp. LAM2023]
MNTPENTGHRESAPRKTGNNLQQLRNVITKDVKNLFNVERWLLLLNEQDIRWIGADMPSEHAGQRMLNLGAPAETFECHQVSTAVGNVRSEESTLVEGQSAQPEG